MKKGKGKAQHLYSGTQTHTAVAAVLSHHRQRWTCSL